MRGFSTSLFALAATASLVAAQTSSPYTDPTTSITYQRYYSAVGTNASYAFGLVFPATPGTDFIGLLEGPVVGWSGVSLGGSMTNSLLIVAYANGDGVTGGLREASGYVAPDAFSGNASLTTMYQSVNSTHFSWTFECKSCTSWGDDYGFDPTSSTAVMGWAVAEDAVTDTTDAQATLQYHEAGMGQYAMLVAQANSTSYASYLAAAPTSNSTTGSGNSTTGSNSTSTATPTSSAVAPATALPAATETLGTYDYIVVGGGAGGLISADRLSETGAKTLLIERGPPATARWGGTLMPSWLEGHNLTRFDVPGLCNEIWVDSTGVACDDVDQMAGCVLGGGTAVNAGMFFKPQDRDWDYNFPAGWQSTDMSDATERLFSRIPSTTVPSMDGKSYAQGPYDVIGPAVEKSGWSEVTINETPNSKNKTYAHAPFMYSNGERGGPLATYLVTAAARSNFEMQLNTTVRRVLRNGSEITGVEVYTSAGSGKTGIYAVTPGTGKVVLSAGALSTPKILFRSGIGPKDQLQVVAASTEDGSSMIAEDDWIISPVGYNLMDQTNTDLVAENNAVDAYDWYGAYKSPIVSDADNYINSRSGVFAVAAPGIPLVLYDRVTPDDGIVRQIQWTARAEGTDNHSITLSQYLGTGFTSRGRVTIKSNLDMTVSTLPYLKTDGDKQAVLMGVENLMNAILGTSGNATSPTSGSITFSKPGSNESVVDYVNDYLQSRGSNHWMGSAKLGADDGTKGNGTSGDVVDVNTKVYGTSNLFVIDASIFPGHVATNPSAPIMIAAERAIERILSLNSTTPETAPYQNSTSSIATLSVSATAKPTGTATLPVGTVTSSVAVPTSTAAAMYYQCGGKLWKGTTVCATGLKCVEQNPYYHQCLAA